jgi:redox-sensitive bicupin YhaK (pirin superfamily)
LIDHSDSLGAAARFGHGDVQWLTAGAGIVHSEMFPLLEREKPNPVELFQIWLNLPREDKMVKPHFTMLWGRDIPHAHFTDRNGKRTEVTVIAGELEGHRPPAPPPHSWAARPDSGVVIWTIRLEPGATWTLPPASTPGAQRTLYFFKGGSLKVDEQSYGVKTGLDLVPTAAVKLEAIDGECEALLLQGKPIAEPVVQYGPFVMNTREEIQRAFLDYQATQFGGWPWPKDDPDHGRSQGRFAKHLDGRIETIDGAPTATFGEASAAGLRR